jgi:type IV secretory pathway VirB4 component
MYRLAIALQGYREAGSLNEQINLFGFVDDHTFLTKSGDVGVVLAIKGVDYEGLASSEIDNYTKRLESTLPAHLGRRRFLSRALPPRL